jgi:four helix bundle protein
VQGVYELTETFPAHERYGLASQLQRAAVSVPSNIAEGHTRHHLKEYLNHLSIAQASLAELDTQLEIAIRLDYISPDKSADIREHLDSLGKQLRALRRSLSKPPSAR